MTTYSWPTTGVHPYLVSSLTWRQIHNNRRSNSSLNGTTQTTSLPGSRWGVTLDFPKHTYAERAELEGFLSCLSGMEHRLSLWDLARSMPSGNWKPIGVTASAASQFVQSLTLAGCRGSNFVRYPQNATFWSKANAVVTANTPDTTAPDGTQTASRIDVTAGLGNYLVEPLWTTVTDGVTPQYRSIYVKAGTISKVFFEGWGYTSFDASTGLAGTGGVMQPVGGGWYRCSKSRASAAFSSRALYLDNIGAAVNSGYLYIWGAQINEASTLPAYDPFAKASAGDWLNVPTSSGNQLVMVGAAATADDAGSMTVEFRPMLRGSVANGAAITITRPSALFTLAQPELAIPRGASGICPPFSLDLVEVFA